MKGEPLHDGELTILNGLDEDGCDTGDLRSNRRGSLFDLTFGRVDANLNIARIEWRQRILL